MTTPVVEGSVRSKALTSSQQLDNITTELNECLLVYVTFKGTSAPTEVRYGLRDMRRVFQRIDNVNAFGHALYTIRNVGNPRTANVVVTYPAEIAAKSIVAITLPNEHNYDTHVSALNADTGAPSATITDTLQESDEFAMGFALAENSTNQTSPAFAGWTNIVDDSTVGTPVASNNHWIIGYQNLVSADNDVAYTGAGGTVADWVTTVVTFLDIQPVVWDVNGSRLYVGNTVDYRGTTYTISSLPYKFRNVVVLSNGDTVPAIETELV